MDKQNIEQLLRESGGIIRLQGREYVTFRGLLFTAHEAGLESIDVKMASWDPQSKTCIMMATVKGKRGVFTDVGDASPHNVNKMIANATIRMASTRAQARALRSYLGVGFTSLEELPGDRQTKPEPKPQQKVSRPFNYSAAADWAVSQGAFSSFEEALQRARWLLTSELNSDEKRHIWCGEVERLLSETNETSEADNTSDTDNASETNE